MELKEAQEKFISAWGAIGTHWGINRTMAQIHALLLISNNALSTEDIMSQLNISRGNVNMNVRELMSWGIVHKVLKFGERKEFFTAEKDIYKTAIQILKERRKRELIPILNLLGELQSENIQESGGEHFKKVVGDIHQFGESTNKMLEKMVKADEHWFTGSLMKFLVKK
ncbi:MAG: transcriptional regulator [Flavobacteriales bacterium]|nr:transcriptional regulator [Flavobacteriales bacterium]MBO72363.1 transcriptional regulator [Flavobacteriales bacterium]|tara:strand:+ start:555 stop:1061 length:507 start_codon:yes stop_codon:yes gene_type:complete